MTDLHLDQADEAQRGQLLDRLRTEQYNAAVLTGDISIASRLTDDLATLAEACSPRMLYFVLGNHDFHGSSFDAVDEKVARVCAGRNLHHLQCEEVIDLGSGSALVGHRGWADARAGYGKRTRIPPRDALCIQDFAGKPDGEVFDRMEALGDASARSFRHVLPYALTCYSEVWVATHVPPFAESAHYNGHPCGPLHAPHYTNLAVGKVIRGVAGHFGRKRLRVLCGHTHCPVVYRPSESLEVHTGRVLLGRPGVQRVFELRD